MKDPFLLAFSISIFGLFLLLINTVLFFITKRFFKKNKLYKALLMYLTIYFAIELTCNTLGFLKPNSNIFISHFAFNLQYLILSVFFYKLFKERMLKRIVIIAFVLFFTTNSIYYLNNLNLFWQFNLFEIAFISFVTIGYTLIHLYKNLGEAKNYFYFTIGISTYMLTSCIIFLSGNIELVFFEEPYIDIWVFNSLFFIAYQYLIFKEWRYLNFNKRDVR
jgi:hypothetical protein